MSGRNRMGSGREKLFTFTLDLCVLYIAQVSTQINVNTVEQILGSCWRLRRRAHPRTGLRVVAGEWPGARPPHPRNRRPLGGPREAGGSRPSGAGAAPGGSLAPPADRPPPCVRREAASSGRAGASWRARVRAGARVCPGRARARARVPALAGPSASLPAALVRPPLREPPGPPPSPATFHPGPRCVPNAHFTNPKCQHSCLSPVGRGPDAQNPAWGRARAENTSTLESACA